MKYILLTMHFTEANRINLFDMYKIGDTTDVSLKTFGEVDSSLSVPLPEMWDRRSDMEGYPLRYKNIIVSKSLM